MAEPLRVPQRRKDDAELDEATLLISRLPEHQQRILRMRFDECMSIQDIAKRLGEPFDVVNKSYQDAIAACRPQLKVKEVTLNGITPKTNRVG